MNKKEGKIEKIERLYGKDYGTKDSKKLGRYLRKIGFSSLAKLLKL